MTCSSEAWALVLSGCPVIAFRWQKLAALPWGHYHAAVGTHGGTAFMYGGHLCSATKGQRPEYYLDTLVALDLRAAVDATLTDGLPCMCKHRIF